MSSARALANRAALLALSMLRIGRDIAAAAFDFAAPATTLGFLAAGPLSLLGMEATETGAGRLPLLPVSTHEQAPGVPAVTSGLRSAAVAEGAADDASARDSGCAASCLTGGAVASSCLTGGVGLLPKKEATLLGDELDRQRDVALLIVKARHPLIDGVPAQRRCGQPMAKRGERLAGLRVEPSLQPLRVKDHGHSVMQPRELGVHLARDQRKRLIAARARVRAATSCFGWSWASKQAGHPQGLAILA